MPAFLKDDNTHLLFMCVLRPPANANTTVCLLVKDTFQALLHYPRILKTHNPQEGVNLNVVPPVLSGACHQESILENYKLM